MAVPAPENGKQGNKAAPTTCEQIIEGRLARREKRSGLAESVPDPKFSGSCER
jgi:hypothetical protein